MDRVYDIRISDHQRKLIIAALKAAPSTDQEESDLMVGMFENLPNNTDADLNDFVSDPFG